MIGKIRRRKINRILAWLHWKRVQATELLMRTITGKEYPSIGIGLAGISYYMNYPARIRLCLKEYPELREQILEFTLASLEHELIHHILLREEGLKTFLALDKVNSYNTVERDLIWRVRKVREVKKDKT